MFIETNDRLKIYQCLFQEGVMVIEKKFGKARHPNVDVPNVYVIKLMQSLETKGFVVSRFSWGHSYHTLTPEGIDHIKEILGLPFEIVPRTMIKSSPPQHQQTRSRHEDAGDDRMGRSGGDRYRMPRQESMYEGEGDKSSNWRRDYRGAGIGRGAPPVQS